MTYGRGASGYFYWSARSSLRSLADGDIVLRNNADTSFGKLQFGGTSSSFPALKRNGTTLEAKLADDSAYTALTFGLKANPAAAGTIASAATIAPTAPVTFISGTTAIDTITAPTPISATGGQITLIPTGASSLTTAGNIAKATTFVANQACIITYDATTTKWYPSY